MPTVNSLEIGLPIKKQRLFIGFSREKLAELTDITPRFCYDLELGLKNMSLTTLYKMSDALHLSTDYILFGNRTENDEYVPVKCLVETCPSDYLPHLEGIISHYLQALNELQNKKNNDSNQNI